MSVYDFLFGKTVYKGEQLPEEDYLIETVELESLAGTCRVYFSERQTEAIELNVTGGFVRLSLHSENREEALGTFESTGETITLPLKVKLVDRLELVINAGNKEERIPLW